MPWKVIQWATGSVGRAAIECIQRHPDLELVGCWVHSQDKNGRDVGDLIGTAPIGVRATSSVEDILATDADAVVYAPLLPVPNEVEALLRSGKNVITPVGWFYPDDDDAQSLRAACAEAQVTLHGTGIDPGGVTEIFPLMMTAMSSAVTFVRGEEFSDIRSYSAPDVIRHIMLFGATPEEAVNGPMLSLLDDGFRQSVHMILETLGINKDDAEIRGSHGYAVATAPIDSPIGQIAPGLVAAQRFHWEASVGGDVVVRIGVNWLMGEDNLDPPWSFGAAGQRFEMEVKGDPDSYVVIHGWHADSIEAGLARNDGIVATAAHLVNSIPYVCAAPAGIQTAVDLPMVAGRAHPKFLKRH
ncbi:dihydrodipicolinate reductase [Nocardia sp. NBC_00565]|uniref:NAD(P)H-dependent amine dehydrogenase family protein n=1 Tax=Nocardia sp. NBC_00565 TaxID=2975993 RepID=UPI002E802566|nr:dihydrodipicolinate reductase [Nocardia sp. NBC_00565]WUC02286.1 dihydrodipicolinate reductase [Nocardia sp. NBC_00565]